MAGKLKLYCFDGRGKMESICWLLAAGRVEVCFSVLNLKLHSGKLLFEADRRLLTEKEKASQDAIVNEHWLFSIIKHSYFRHTKEDLKERALIDMYVGGTNDLMGFILMFLFLSTEDKEKKRAVVVQKATCRYFPAYEKVDHGQDFLAGNNFSCPDVHLLEAILMVEEVGGVLSFPQLQAFKERTSSIPTIKTFLEPGSQRKHVPDDKYMVTVRRVLCMYYDIK
ncbi:Glutathione S-transferase 3, partial [Egretta garzetta]